MNLRENQKNYWNKVADTKKFTTPFNIKEFLKYVPKEAKILDVGCGYGRTLEELYKNDYKNLIGIDFSEKLIERGKNLYPKLNLCVQTTENIDFPDNSVDAVILFAVLTCIIDNSAQKHIISEIKRVLKPGGILYINDFLINSDERNLNRYEIYLKKYNTYGVFELPEGAILRHHNLNYIKDLVSEFKKIEFNKVIYATMNGHKSNGFSFLGQKA